MPGQATGRASPATPTKPPRRQGGIPNPDRPEAERAGNQAGRAENHRRHQEAEAEAAYEIQNQAQQKIIGTATVDAEIAKTAREAELKKQEVEVAKQALDAEIRAKADADRYRKEQEAQAALFQRQKDAEAKRYEQEQEAEAVKKQAEASRFAKEQEAAGISAVGKAEAAAIQAKALAEAEGIDKKAEAMKNTARPPSSRWS